jgi:hypothetical protein
MGFSLSRINHPLIYQPFSPTYVELKMFRAAKSTGDNKQSRRFPETEHARKKKKLEPVSFS